MNIEALIIIGVLALITGVILYLPFFFWFKSKRKKELPENSTMTITVTKNGFVFYGAMILILFAGYGQEYLAPQSDFGLFVSTWSGWVIFTACVIVVSQILEYLFILIGIKFTQRKHKDV